MNKSSQVKILLVGIMILLMSAGSAMCAEDLPSTFDWRDYGKVTPVRDQGDCGSGYAFATLGMFESVMLINNESEYDLSEEHVKECMPMTSHDGQWGQGSCFSGSSRWVINLLTQEGTIHETDIPYRPYPTGCNGAFTPIIRVTDWYQIGGGIGDTNTLQYYIYNKRQHCDRDQLF